MFMSEMRYEERVSFQKTKNLLLILPMLTTQHLQNIQNTIVSANDILLQFEIKLLLDTCFKACSY